MDAWSNQKKVDVQTSPDGTYISFQAACLGVRDREEVIRKVLAAAEEWKQEHPDRIEGFSVSQSEDSSRFHYCLVFSLKK